MCIYRYNYIKYISTHFVNVFNKKSITLLKKSHKKSLRGRAGGQRARAGGYKARGGPVRGIRIAAMGPAVGTTVLALLLAG